MLYNTFVRSDTAYALDSSEHTDKVIEKPTQQHKLQQPPPQTEKSESIYSDPRYPHTIRIVADTIDQLVYNSDSPVLVDVYEESCGACKQTAPIIHLVARCLKQGQKDVPADAQLRVALYESNKNYKKGFLTAEEELAVPTIKLYVKHLSPQQLQQIERDNAAAQDKYDKITVQQHPNNTVSLTYNGPPNARRILEFVHKYTQGSKNEFDLNAAFDCVRKHDTATLSAVQRQSAARIADDPTAFLYDNAPCGEQMKTFMLRTMTHNYISFPTEDDQRATTITFENLTNCLTKRAEDTKEYWSSVLATAQQNLEDALEREKLDTEASKKAAKDGKKKGKLNAEETKQ